jgi:antitoxin ParD1/3/4
MNLTLDAESEKRIQREIDLGHYSEPSEVIAHALRLLDIEDDLISDKQAIEEHLDEGFAQVQRGEGIPREEAREYFIRNRAARAAGQPLESASEFFRRRAAGAKGDALGRAINAVPSRQPDPNDELEQQ